MRFDNFDQIIYPTLTRKFKHVSVAARVFCSYPVLFTKEWRVSKGLSINKNAEGILTDGPDYTFLDGRPTPLLVII